MVQVSKVLKKLKVYGKDLLLKERIANQMKLVLKIQLMINFDHKSANIFLDIFVGTFASFNI